MIRTIHATTTFVGHSRQMAQLRCEDCQQFGKRRGHDGCPGRRTVSATRVNELAKQAAATLSPPPQTIDDTSEWHPDALAHDHRTAKLAIEDVTNETGYAFERLSAFVTNGRDLRDRQIRFQAIAPEILNGASKVHLATEHVPEEQVERAELAAERCEKAIRLEWKIYENDVRRSMLLQPGQEETFLDATADVAARVSRHQEDFSDTVNSFFKKPVNA